MKALLALCLLCAGCLPASYNPQVAAAGAVMDNPQAFEYSLYAQDVDFYNKMDAQIAESARATDLDLRDSFDRINYYQQQIDDADQRLRQFQASHDSTDPQQPGLSE